MIWLLAVSVSLFGWVAIALLRVAAENPWVGQLHVHFYVQNGQTQEYILDLTQMAAYEQSNILIRPGDVIYVPSKNGKAFDKKSSRILPFLTVISTIAVLMSVAK